MSKDKNEKVLKINDRYADAKETLTEDVALLERMFRIEGCLTSYADVLKEKPNLTKGQYMQLSVKSLISCCRINFSVMYPHLQSHFINGDGVQHASAKLASAVTSLESLLSQLRESSYLIVSDKDRAEYREVATTIIKDLILFIITQFQLQPENVTQYLPTCLYCESAGVSYDEFMNTILGYRDRYNADYYVYEEPCMEAEQFSGAFQGVYQLAEDTRYPLTKARAREILDNPELINELQEDIERYADNIEVITKNISQKDVLNRMTFD